MNLQCSALLIPNLRGTRVKYYLQQLLFEIGIISQNGIKCVDRIFKFPIPQTIHLQQPCLELYITPVTETLLSCAFNSCTPRFPLRINLFPNNENFDALGFIRFDIWVLLASTACRAKTMLMLEPGATSNNLMPNCYNPQWLDKHQLEGNKNHSTFRRGSNNYTPAGKYSFRDGRKMIFKRFAVCVCLCIGGGGGGGGGGNRNAQLYSSNCWVVADEMAKFECPQNFLQNNTRQISSMVKQFCILNERPKLLTYLKIQNAWKILHLEILHSQFSILIRVGDTTQTAVYTFSRRRPRLQYRQGHEAIVKRPLMGLTIDNTIRRHNKSHISAKELKKRGRKLIHLRKLELSVW
ncbi:hypothetical protein WN51_11916 [Melipona quadrifasciata]|uniref:Uncharacterized protein n=1 Tax=Melipona quadrifasciata TaxID=166423 RepID=A0A0M9A4A4_9HYME|nr:hypothetical protein WN51_11916 [Melipona quadrifasciata]